MDVTRVARGADGANTSSQELYATGMKKTRETVEQRPVRYSDSRGWLVKQRLAVHQKARRDKLEIERDVEGKAVHNCATSEQENRRMLTTSFCLVRSFGRTSKLNLI